MNFLRCAIAGIALAATVVSIARAEDDGWIEVKAEQPQNNHNNWLADPNNFDQWVFQHTNDYAGQQKRFATKLELSLREIDSACQLDESQRRRLELAGKIDIQNFFAEYHRIRDELYSGEPDQEDFNNIWQIIQPLHMKVQTGLTDDESLLRKASQEVLRPEQSEAFSRTEHARRIYRYSASVRLYLSMIDSTMPLQASQRESLTKLALSETKPPNRCHSQSLQLYVQYQLSQIDPKAIRKAVPGEQGDLLVKLFKQGRGYEHHLQQQGIHPHGE